MLDKLLNMLSKTQEIQSVEATNAKENLLNVLGISLPTGFTLLSIVEKAMPILQCAGIIVGLIVGITAIWLNLKRIKNFNKDTGKSKNNKNTSE